MTNSQVLSELRPWQSKRFREYELPWVKAVESLLTKKPLIELRSNKDGTRWTVYNKTTDKVAIFSHAGIWCWASPPQTGNFVPEGESPPEGIHSSRIQPVLSRKIETSYAFNMEDDPSFYRCARILEDHAVAIEGFNKYKKSRRNWQEGNTEYTRRRFIFSSRLVVRRTPHNSKEGQLPVLSYQLHPWLEAAINAQRYPVWMANPEMPAILEYEESRLKMLRPTSHRYFANGDIVWFSFALSFDVNSNNWMPEYKPLDFIRVGALPESYSNGGDYSAAESVATAYRSLSTGVMVPLDDDDDDFDLTQDPFFASSQNPAEDLKRLRDSDGDDTLSDDGLSDHSAYSAALAALDRDAKKLKIEATSSSNFKSSSAKSTPGKGASKGKGKA